MRQHLEISNPQKGVSMQTAVKQQTQTKSSDEPSLIPIGVKKVMQQASEKSTTEKQMSGDLSRLLDANSDCV